MLRHNTVYNHDGFYVSVAYNITYDNGDLSKLIDETALVFEENGRKRYWILKHDVHSIYEGLTLEQAKAVYRQEHIKGKAGFWTDYSHKEEVTEDNL